MTKGITEREPDPRAVYGDIIDLPHHVSERHPAMSLYDRAAQFSPYAALTGYHDLVKEEARLVDERIELSDGETEQLNRKLKEISRMIKDGTRPEAAMTYFVPDPVKEGGRYETVTESIRKVDPVRQVIVLQRKTGISGGWAEIPIGDILDINSVLG